MKLADTSAEIGWTLLEATHNHKVDLLTGACGQLASLMQKLEQISTSLQDALPVPVNGCGVSPKRLLAIRDRGNNAEVLAGLDRCTGRIRPLLAEIGSEYAPLQSAVLDDLKSEVATLTGVLSMANI